MSSGTFYSAANADDGRFNNTTGAGFNTSDDEQYLGYPVASFFRFPSITVAKDSLITVAYVSLYAKNDATATGIINIYAEDVDNSVAVANGADGLAKIKTTVYVAWDRLMTPGRNNTPSLVDVIQEVVDRPGWSLNNAIQLFFWNVNFVSWEPVWAYNKGDPYRPYLYLEWLAPVTEGLSGWNNLDMGDNISIDEVTYLTATHA